MRELTEQELEARGLAFNTFAENKGTFRVTTGDTIAFNAGFTAGLECQEAQAIDEIAELSNVLTLVYNAGPRAWRRADHPLGQRIRAALAKVEGNDDTI